VEGITLQKALIALKEQTKAVDPRAPDPTLDQALTYLNVLTMGDPERTKGASRAKAMSEIRTWMRRTVNLQLYESVHRHFCAQSDPLRDTTDKEAEPVNQTEDDKNPTNRQIIREIRKRLAPSAQRTKEEARRAYNSVLLDAAKANQSPSRWIVRWMEAHNRAVNNKVEEIEGIQGVTSFLRAIGARFAPEWANRKLEDLAEIEATGIGKIEPLTHYATIFQVVVSSHFQAKKGAVIAATLGNKGTNPQVAGNGKNNLPAKQDCPCLNASKRYPHRFGPEACHALKYAVTGQEPPSGAYKPVKEQCEAIRKRFNSPKWASLKTKLNQKGWIETSTTPGIPFDESKPNSDSKAKGYPKFPFSAAILDANLIEGEEHLHGVYSTVEQDRHPLSMSTLLDNCGALHVVNNESLLVPGTLQPTRDDWIEAGTTQFQVQGRGT
jgi:hypothetical protein